MTKSRREKNLLILLLGALTALSPFSIDMYLPAFQKVAEDFNTTVAQVSLTLSSYFIGLSVGQLFYGPLLDRFGRKKPLYGGLLLYIVTTLACLMAHSIETLVVLRFIQAIGGCAAGVASFAMVRDSFTMKESSKVFSLLILILGVSPLVAPTAGGYVSAAWGWHSVFIFLALIAAMLLACSVFFLKESHQPDTSVSLRAGPIFRNFLGVLKVPQFYTYTLAGAVAFAGLFVYVAGSPVIYLEIFKMEPQIYGWIFAGLSVGFIGASQLNIFLIRHYRNEDIFFWALIGQVIVTSIFLVGTLNGWYGVYGTTALLFCFLCTVGLANPNGAALAMAPFSKNAGSASALMGFLQMGSGALASMIVGIFTGKEILPIVLILFFASIIALSVLLFGRRKITDRVDVQDGGVIAAH
ncbi:MAG: Bcr/CflA family efflux MFS transporter [Proteobacteria bacterium]|nr:MAG: Bcr/CflA family efflux MFS transporter [Pseudomonadota bacterium]